MSCGRLALWQGPRTVDVVVRQRDTQTSRESDQVLGHRGRQSLASLVVADVALSAAETERKRSLRDA